MKTIECPPGAGCPRRRDVAAMAGPMRREASRACRVVRDLPGRRGSGRRLRSGSRRRPGGGEGAKRGAHVVASADACASGRGACRATTDCRGARDRGRSEWRILRWPRLGSAGRPAPGPCLKSPLVLGRPRMRPSVQCCCSRRRRRTRRWFLERLPPGSCSCRWPSTWRFRSRREFAACPGRSWPSARSTTALSQTKDGAPRSWLRLAVAHRRQEVRVRLRLRHLREQQLHRFDR